MSTPRADFADHTHASYASFSAIQPQEQDPGCLSRVKRFFSSFTSAQPKLNDLRRSADTDALREIHVVNQQPSTPATAQSIRRSASNQFSELDIQSLYGKLEGAAKSTSSELEMISSYVFVPEAKQPLNVSVVKAAQNLAQVVIRKVSSANFANSVNRFLNSNPPHLPIVVALRSQQTGQITKAWSATTDDHGFIASDLDCSGLAPGHYTLEFFSERTTDQVSAKKQDDASIIFYETLGECVVQVLPPSHPHFQVIIPDLDNTCWHTAALPFHPSTLRPTAGFRDLKTDVTWCWGMKELQHLFGRKHSLESPCYVHAVTGSPIALQKNITEVFSDADFPRLGGVATKLIRQHGVSGMAKSFSYKTFQILEALLHYPQGARLLFLGDDGQQDPQVYALLLAALKGNVTVDQFVTTFKQGCLAEHDLPLDAEDECVLRALLQRNLGKHFNVDCPGFIRRDPEQKPFKLERSLQALNLGQPIDWICAVDDGVQIAADLCCRGVIDFEEWQQYFGEVFKPVHTVSLAKCQQQQSLAQLERFISTLPDSEVKLRVLAQLAPTPSKL